MRISVRVSSAPRPTGRPAARGSAAPISNPAPPPKVDEAPVVGRVPAWSILPQSGPAQAGLPPRLRSLGAAYRGVCDRRCDADRTAIPARQRAVFWLVNGLVAGSIVFYQDYFRGGTKVEPV